MSEPADPAAQLVELDKRMRRLEQQLEDLELDLHDPDLAGLTAQPWRFVDLEQFVELAIRNLVRRRVGGQLRWCASWALHSEAVFRLDCLWRAYEVSIREDPELGIANWVRDYLDPCLDVLLSPTGPFAACTPQRHEPDHALPSAPIPIGVLPRGLGHEPNHEPAGEEVDHARA